MRPSPMALRVGLAPASEGVAATMVGGGAMLPHDWSNSTTMCLARGVEPPAAEPFGKNAISKGPEGIF